MSQKCGTVDGDAGETKKALTLEALQRYLAEDRDAAADRTESILARFFKVGIVIVCLNVVIAGANVAMIMIRPSTPRVITVTAPAMAPAPPPVVQPARPAELPLATPEPQAPLAEQPPAALAMPALPPAPATVKPPEKRVPLLGPLPSNPRSLPVLAKRPTQMLARPPLPKPYLSAEDADEEADDRPSPPPERW
jgi:hypothetical protein